MADTRYQAVLTRIKNRMNLRDADLPSDIKVILADNASYMAMRHPNGWSWLRNKVELNDQSNSIPIDATLDSGTLPRTYGMWIVRGRLNNTGDWRAFQYAPLGALLQWPEANRSEVTVLPQQMYWTVLDDGGTRSIEIYPTSFATDILDVEVYYIQQVDEIPASDEDAAFIWPERGYDGALAWLTMSDIAFARNDLTREAAVFSRWTEVITGLLIGEGVPMSRIKFPPRRIIQQVGIAP